MVKGMSFDMSEESSADLDQPGMAIQAILFDLLRHPVERLVNRWNWKSAFLSAIIRGSLFFFSNLEAGLSAASVAMSLESVFIIVTAGFYGAILESFRSAQPAWKAHLAATLLLPTMSHTLEFLLHWTGGTERLATGMMASISLSLVSASFNLYAMRRGLLLTGTERQPFWRDLMSIPALFIDFLRHILLLLRIPGIKK